MDITAAIHYVQDLALSVKGVRAAPDEPPDTLGADVEVITFEASGELETDKPLDWGPQHGVIRSELHVLRGDLPQTIQRALAFREPFLRKILNDPNLGGTVMIVNKVTWTFGPMSWGTANPAATVGYRFDIDVDLELTTG